MCASNQQIQNKITTWPDSLADDYIHQPIDNELDQICFYDMTRCYKKGFNASQNVQINDKEEKTYIHGGVKKYKFKETHPGHKFSHLIQLKFPCPRFSISLCIQANQHRTKIAKNKFELGMLS